MKVLLVNDYGTPAGGAELMTLALRRLLRERGHDARLFTSSADVGGGANQADYTCYGTTSSFRTLLQSYNPFAASKLKTVLEEFQPDLVHVRMFLTQLSPSILPLLRDVPSLMHVVWYRPICPLGTKMLPDRCVCTKPPGTVCYTSGCLPLRDWLPIMGQMKLFRDWRSAFKKVVANSYSVRDRLIGEGMSPVDVVWNGIPPKPQRPALTHPPMAGYAGRLVAEKGVDTLVRAFAKVLPRQPDARLAICGDGPERDNITALIHELNVGHAIRLYGHLSQDALAELFAHVWVQAVPSMWPEPFGIVAPEAMMRGTAVVASNSGGLAETVQHGKTGFHVAPGDVDGFADAMYKLLSNRELAESMGAQGRQVAMASFSEERFVEGFLDLYDQMGVNTGRTRVPPATGHTPFLGAEKAIRLPVYGGT